VLTKWLAVATVLVTSSLAVEGLPFRFGGVSALQPSPTNQVIATPSPTPNETLQLSKFSTIQPSTLSPSPVRQETSPVLFDLVMNYTGTSDLNQLTQDVDGVLEDYMLSSLQYLNGDGLTIQEVLLGVTLTTRRRRLQAKDIAVKVDGNVTYDIGSLACAKCADEKIQTALGQILTLPALNQTIRSAGITGVSGVTAIQDTLPVSNRAGNQSAGRNNINTRSKVAGLQSAQQPSSKNQLQRPSTLSIAFGFVLTAIAFLGLVFYAYVFHRKRQKRLRKEKQQRQSIEYRMPPSSRSIIPANIPVKSNLRASPAVSTPPPMLPIPALGDDFSEEGDSFKALETLSSDGGPADSFARELQMAANLDQRVWEDFQRKKAALDRDREIPTSYGPLGSTSPIPPPPNPPSADPSKPDTWTKSFPYGDEPMTVAEQGVEWTADGYGGNATDNDGGDSWEPYNSRMPRLPEEKKDDYASRLASRDPAPVSPISRETSATMQSVELTLVPRENSNSFRSDDPGDVLDEVARLSRFVQRYEKRKERRIQRESGRFSRDPTETDAQASTTFSVSDPSTIRGPAVERSNPSKQNENNGNLNNMRSSPSTRPQNSRPRYDATMGDNSKVASYTGINMAGGLYQDPSLRNINRPVSSMSEESDDDSYRDEEESALSHRRLGISPFSVQKTNAAPAYSEGIISPTMDIISKTIDKEQPAGTRTNGAVRKLFPPDNRRMERPYTQSHGSSSHSNKSRLSDLRTNNAIIDSSESDVNVGNFPTLGSTTSASPGSQQMARSPFFKTPTKTGPRGTPNQKFNRLRSLFEERPKKAIFPPDEHWQSGALKN